MTAVERPLFGSLAICKGHCTLDELDVALDAQRDAAPAPPIGQILVEMGNLTPEQVEALLKEQSGGALPSVVASTAPAPAPEPPKAVAASDENKPAALPGRVHALIGRVLPFLHQHRTYLLLAILPGLLAIVLPWRLGKNGVWAHGVQGPGWLSFLLLAAAGGWLLAGDRSKPLSRRDRWTVIALGGLAVLVGLWKLFSAPEWAVAMGVGIPLAFVSALLVPAVAWPMRAVDGDPAASPLGRLKRVWRDLSGRRAKEKAEWLARRDGLLKSIAEAAVAAPAPEGEPEPVKAARQALNAPAGPKPVPGKRERALLRLGRALVDADATSQAAEVRALDERLKTFA